MNDYDIAVICLTGVCLALIGAGTYLGRQFLLRMAAVKQPAATGGKSGTAAADKSSTKAAIPAIVPPSALGSLAPVEDAAEGSAA